MVTSIDLTACNSLPTKAIGPDSIRYPRDATIHDRAEVMEYCSSIAMRGVYICN